MHFLQPPITSFYLVSSILSTPFSNILGLRSSLNVRDQVLFDHNCTIIRKWITILALASERIKFVHF
jgi:hypothetical protein